MGKKYRLALASRQKKRAKKKQEMEERLNIVNNIKPLPRGLSKIDRQKNAYRVVSSEMGNFVIKNKKITTKVKKTIDYGLHNLCLVNEDISKSVYGQNIRRR